MGVALAKKGCKRLGVVIDEGGQAYAAQTAHAAKWQSVTNAFIPLAAPDLTPDIAKLVQAHVQCVAAASLGSQIPQILTAMQQEHLKVPTALPGIILTGQVIKSLGPLSNGLIAVESTPSPTSAAVANVTKKMHAVNKGIRVDSASLTGWAAAKFIADGAAEVHGPVTSASLLAGLNKLRNASTDGLLPPLSTAPQAKASDRRDFDTYVQSFVIQNGKRTDASGYFNILPQLNAVSS
jgi:ABC-type branched-subunit amino acid transport system substrate-binding protein